ncbi:MAG: PD-(D/E)XK nuclease family protein [Bacteroidetes bacterium]|nr:PD-(D/E)XK nuclease family protein [Bacteroidota bacterium]MDA0950467.1 PD-(D/E)XK nuclease family protein [Bacteroidota bacterium]
MESFVRHTLSQLEQYAPLDGFIYVVPNRRSVSAVYEALAEKLDAPIWAPSCIPIDDLFEGMSSYALMSSTDQLFELFKVYNSVVGKAEKISLKAFQSLGKLLLQDFNEIDLALTPSENLFKELEKLIELDSTFAPEEQTDLMRSHLSRVRSIAAVYTQFVAHCDRQKMGYQGLLYRRAHERMQTYLQSHQTPFIFIGFNAFSKAEQEIVKSLLVGLKESRIFWDIDWDLLQDDQHESGLFIRRYRAEWSFLDQQRPFCVFKENNALFHRERSIEIIESPGVLAQCHALNELLQAKESFENTAIVLADETLLEAVMRTLNVGAEKGPINITMGNALLYTATSDLIHTYIDLRRSFADTSPYIGVQQLKRFVEHPLQSNQTVPSYTHEEWLVSRVKKSALKGSAYFVKSETPKQEWLLFLSFLEDLASETAQVIFDLMQTQERRIVEIATEEPVIDCIEVLFKELLSTQKTTFKGDPKSGLQLMGILETRNLQFETVIVLSLNEKIIPKGRSYGSLLPYDLKRAYDIPTFKEKDAIYTYYFYRLLQGASKAHLLYNSQLGAFETKEKSRLLFQLALEPRLEKQILYRSVYFDQQLILPDAKKNLLTKSPAFYEALSSHFSSGLSVSSLLAYLHDPANFYSRYLLHITEPKKPSDRIEANLLGTLIHDTLDALYKNHTQAALNTAVLDEIYADIEIAIKTAYETNNLSTEAENGRSILIYDVIKAYVTAVIQADRETLEKGSILRILSLEETYYKDVPHEITQKLGLNNIKLKGKIDRIDEIDGVLRITDYKTGSIALNDAVFKQVEECISKRKQKVFQLLFYNYLLFEHVNYKPYFESQNVSASIFSTKNKAHYYLTQDKIRFKGAIDQLAAFEQLIKGLITEICSGDTFDLKASRD